MARIKWRDKEIDSLISPNTSISKEYLRADDGTVVAQKHTITVKGYILASGDPLSDQEDSRQNYLYGRILDFLNLGSTGSLNNIPKNQAGLLEIQPVGAGSHVIKYDGAQLISLSLPETPDDTAGIQYQEYGFTFESYQPAYSSGDIYSSYRIKSVNESWDVEKQEDAVSFTNMDFNANNSDYNYVLKHTVSAVGLPSFNNGSLGNTAFYEAYNYVNTRLKSDVTSQYISSDVYNNAIPASSAFSIDSWRSSGISSGNVVNPTGYLSYNKVRQSSSDIAGGSYSVTSSYTMSRNSGNIEISANYNEDENGDISVSIEGSITPLSRQSISSLVNDKYVIASSIYNQVSDSGNWTKATVLASSVLSTYKPSGCNNSLVVDRYPRSISVGRNKNNGNITFNLNYKGISSGVRNLKDSITGCITANVTVTDDNRSNSYGLGYKSIAIVPIIGKTDGPIIQDMGTTKERRRTVSFDVTMKQSCRSFDSPPTGSIYPLMESYKPVGSSYVQNFTENWEWVNGRYNLSVDWIYI